VMAVSLVRRSTVAVRFDWAVVGFCMVVSLMPGS
jgi:hypothetical protein